MKGPDAGIPTNIGQPKTAGEHASAYTRAAEAILKHAPDAQAFAGSDRPLITGHIPLPKSARSRGYNEGKALLMEPME